MFHFIIIKTLKTKKYAYHYQTENYKDMKIKRHVIIKEIKENAPEMLAMGGFHTIKCKTKSFNELKKWDPYFQSMIEVKTIDELIKKK